MTRALVPASVLNAPDYDRTLVLSIEQSNASWVLAAEVPDLPRVKSERTIQPTAEAVRHLVKSTPLAETDRRQNLASAV